MSYADAQPPQQPPPPVLSPPDEQNLDLLAVLFFVYSAFVGLGAVAFGGVAIMGLVLIPTSTRPGAPPEAALLGGVFLVVFGLVAVFFVAKAVVMILAGLALRRRSGYVLAFVAACLALTNIPLGTALGVFALITLLKPGVRDRLSR